MFKSNVRIIFSWFLLIFAPLLVGVFIFSLSCVGICFLLMKNDYRFFLLIPFPFSIWTFCILFQIYFYSISYILKVGSIWKDKSLVIHPFVFYCFFFACFVSCFLCGWFLVPSVFAVLLYVLFAIHLISMINNSSIFILKENWNKETFFKYVEDIKNNKFKIKKVIRCECFRFSGNSSSGYDRIVSYEEDKVIHDLFIQKIEILNESTILRRIRTIGENVRVKFKISFIVDDTLKEHVDDQINHIKNENKGRDEEIYVGDSGWKMEGLENDQEILFGNNLPSTIMWKILIISGFFLCWFPFIDCYISKFKEIEEIIHIKVYLKYLKSIDSTNLLKGEKSVPLKDVVNVYSENWKDVKTHVEF